jgi:hypothetical protein
MKRAVKHLAIIRKNDEYGTPLFYYHEACKNLDVKPVIDYFASDVNHVCDKYYTKPLRTPVNFRLAQNVDAFTKSWTEDGFINPPYSIVSKVLEKAYNEHVKNGITLLILTYSKTDTQWWHRFVEEGSAEISFPKRRISFLNSDGYLTKKPSPYPSVWIVFRGAKNNGRTLLEVWKKSKTK